MVKVTDDQIVCTSSGRSRGATTNESSKVLVVVAKDVVLVALVATMPARFPYP